MPDSQGRQWSLLSYTLAPLRNRQKYRIPFFEFRILDLGFRILTPNPALLTPNCLAFHPLPTLPQVLLLRFSLPLLFLRNVLWEFDRLAQLQDIGWYLVLRQCRRWRL